MQRLETRTTHLSRSPPASLAPVACVRVRKSVCLSDLSHAALTGLRAWSFPVWVSRGLYLSDNTFHGLVPYEFSSLQSLRCVFSLQSWVALARLRARHVDARLSCLRLCSFAALNTGGCPCSYLSVPPESWRLNETDSGVMMPPVDSSFATQTSIRSSGPACLASMPAACPKATHAAPPPSALTQHARSTTPPQWHHTPSPCTWLEPAATPPPAAVLGCPAGRCFFEETYSPGFDSRSVQVDSRTKFGEG